MFKVLCFLLFSSCIFAAEQEHQIAFYVHQSCEAQFTNVLLENGEDGQYQEVIIVVELFNYGAVQDERTLIETPAYHLDLQSEYIEYVIYDPNRVVADDDFEVVYTQKKLDSRCKDMELYYSTKLNQSHFEPGVGKMNVNGHWLFPDSKINMALQTLGGDTITLELGRNPSDWSFVYEVKNKQWVKMHQSKSGALKLSSKSGKALGLRKIKNRVKSLRAMLEKQMPFLYKAGKTAKSQKTREVLFELGALIELVR